MKDTDSAVYAQELERLAQEGGGVLTTAAIIESAESEDSPLHDYFEWDDSEAARLYRANQARTLIRSVKLPVTSKTIIPSVKYMHDPSAGSKQQGYVEIASVKSSAELSAAAMARELKSVLAYLHRALAIASELGMSDDIAHLIEAIDGISGRLDKAA